MNEAVGHGVVPAAVDIVPAVNRLAAAVRAAGGGVFWAQMTHDEACVADWSVALEMVSEGNAALTQTAHDAALTAFYNIPGDVQDTDMIVAALERGRSSKAPYAAASAHGLPHASTGAERT